VNPFLSRKLAHQKGNVGSMPGISAALEAKEAAPTKGKV
jgi:hypothetical protein